jgi:cell wall-associated NlpC family hydrolase
MGKLRRGGFVFFVWKGDYGPRHVHVYRGGRLVVKWDLDNEKTMIGKASRKVLDLIRELQLEGLL